MNKNIYTSTMDYYSALRKNEILPFSTIQMDLEDVMLSDIHQILYNIPYMWKKQNKTKTELENITVMVTKGRGRGRGGERRCSGYTLTLETNNSESANMKHRGYRQ